MATFEHNGPLILARTGEAFTEQDPRGLATVVYFEFTRSLSSSLQLARLSFAAASFYDPKVVEHVFSDSDISNLSKMKYLNDTMGPWQQRATPKAQLAINMITAEYEYDELSYSLVEPFIGLEILPDLHKTYLRTRRVDNPEA